MPADAVQSGAILAKLPRAPGLSRWLHADDNSRTGLPGAIHCSGGSTAWNAGNGPKP